MTFQILENMRAGRAYPIQDVYIASTAGEAFEIQSYLHSDTPTRYAILRHYQRAFYAVITEAKSREGVFPRDYCREDHGRGRCVSVLS